MTSQDQIKALAELDGWTNLCICSVGISLVVGWRSGRIYQTSNPNDFNEPVPAYLTSYDAIIPLIQKQEQKIRLACHYHGDPIVIRGTPAQLSEALLRATGKWTT